MVSVPTPNNPEPSRNGSYRGQTDSLFVTLRSQAVKEYRREKLPDGSVKPETYALVNGGKLPGTIRDGSFEKVPYPEFAGHVARHLASQNHFLARTAAEADLLVVVHWGTTIPFNSTTMNLRVSEVAQAFAEVQGGLQQMPTGSQRMTRQLVTEKSTDAVSGASG